MKAQILSILVIISCFACSDRKIDYSYPLDPDNIRNQRGGKFFEDINIISPRAKKSDSQTDNGLQKESLTPTNLSSKNSALWSSSIEVVGTILPIIAADNKSGLIITDWYMDGDKTSERIKINLLVKDSKIAQESLVLTIFRQAKNKDGYWIDEQSSNSNIAAKMIKDKIIQKALLKND